MEGAQLLCSVKHENGKWEWRDENSIEPIIFVHIMEMEGILVAALTVQDLHSGRASDDGQILALGESTEEDGPD